MRPGLRKTLESLADAQVEVIVIGGVAAVLQGAPMTTFDLDVVHRRTPENVARLVGALQSLGATYRFQPRAPEPELLLGPGHHLFSTNLGPLDVLGVVAGGLAYEDLVTSSRVLAIGTRSVRVLDLPNLIELKERVGRPKDLAALPLLRAVLEERGRRERDQPGPR